MFIATDSLAASVAHDWTTLGCVSLQSDEACTETSCHDCCADLKPCRPFGCGLPQVGHLRLSLQEQTSWFSDVWHSQNKDDLPWEIFSCPLLLNLSMLHSHPSHVTGCCLLWLVDVAGDLTVSQEGAPQTRDISHYWIFQVIFEFAGPCWSHRPLSFQRHPTSQRKTTYLFGF